jgi:hypothetical protein
MHSMISCLSWTSDSTLLLDDRNSDHGQSPKLESTLNHQPITALYWKRRILRTKASRLCLNCSNRFMRNPEHMDLSGSDVKMSMVFPD